MSVSEEITRIKENYLPTIRVEMREKYEEEVRAFLSNIPDISFEDLDTIMSLMDSDYWEDEELEGRFYPLFSKPNRNKIFTNEIEQIRQLLVTTFQNENLENVDNIVSDISGMWYGSASLFFYIRNPSKYNVFLPVTVRGIKKIYPVESKSLRYSRPFDKNYLLFNKLCDKLKKEFMLQPQELDLILTVFGKKEITEDMQEEISIISPAREKKLILDHTHAEAVLLDMGNLLGYETYTADPSKHYQGNRLDEISTLEEVPENLQSIKSIARVDVIWYDEDSPPSYLFEVEDKGTMRDALLRLYQARHLNAKFFIVCPANNRRKFEEWISNAPFNASRKIYFFRTFDDLSELYSLIKNAEEYKRKFGII